MTLTAAARGVYHNEPDMLARLLIVIQVFWLCGPVLAQDGERPWAEGVAPEQQERALSIFREGNELFLASKYLAALGHYREALSLWNHPGIHYNAAVSYINLDQPLAAYDHLEMALAYAEAPLGPQNYAQALLYKKLLWAQLAELHVTCSEPGAQVMLDGELLFTAPGEITRRLMPGAHQLVARKPGLFTESHALQLPAGQFTHEEIKLNAISTMPLRSVRRWNTWMPWLVLGGGVLIAAVGVPLAIDADHNVKTFDAELVRQCPTGCRERELPQSAIDARERGQTENALALTAFIAGGAISAAGLVLLMLNQPHLVPMEHANISIRAHATPSSAGIQATLRM